MDINRLNEFIALATHLNYSKAANQLYLTQPALSRHIHDLEQTLGAQLFIRDTHNVYLTPVGEIFFDEAKAIVERYEHALALVKEATSTTTGEIKLGFLGAAVQPFLGQFVGYFNKKQPNTKLTFQAGDLDPLVKLLNNDEIDCAFVTHVNSMQFSGLASETVLNDPMVIVINPSHPFARKETVELKELDGMPMISFSKQTSPITYEFHKQLFKRHGLQYNVVREVPNIETGLFFVKLNEGFFILPEHLKIMLGDLSYLTYVPFSDEDCRVDLNLIWKKNNPNPSLPVFRKEFTAFMNSNS